MKIENTENSIPNLRLNEDNDSTILGSSVLSLKDQIKNITNNSRLFLPETNIEQIENAIDSKLPSAIERKLNILLPEQIKISTKPLLEELRLEIKKETKEEIEKQVQTDKASLMTVFGIFASVISFLTIEFQFLKTICSIEKITGFTLILFSLLFSFNIGLDYLIKSRLDKESPKPNNIFIFFILILLIFGIFIISKGNEEQCKDNAIYTKYSQEFNEKLNLIQPNNNK